MIRRLAFETLQIKEASPAEKRRAREECKSIIDIYGVLIDIFAIIHLLIAGSALAYIIVLVSTSDFSLWCSYFVRISLPSDIVFYIFTFLIFISNFILVAIMFQVRSANSLGKGLLCASCALLALSLFLTTFSFPMSYMLRQSYIDYGDWYTSRLAETEPRDLLYGSYRILAIVRMILIIIPSFIFPYFVSTIRTTLFQQLYQTM